MTSKFDIKKNLEDLIKDNLIITNAMFGLFFVLWMAKVQLANLILDMEDVTKIAGRTTNSVLVKYFTVFYKWI